MKVVTYSHARNNLRPLLDEISETGEPLCIHSLRTQHVIITKANFDAMLAQIAGDFSGGGGGGYLGANGLGGVNLDCNGATISGVGKISIAGKEIK